MGGKAVQLSDLEQPPFCTTLMGVLKGAADHHGLALSAPALFGLTGHAFLMNIHTELCPSSPYCWKLETVLPLIENMGLRMTYLGFFGTDASPETRADVEAKLRDALDRGVPCSALNMEHQLICGYDADGFLMTQPWGPDPPVTPARLTFGSWAEFGEQVHACFFTIEKTDPAPHAEAVLASLAYAVDLQRHPSAHSSEASGAGSLAYDNWIAAVPGHGAGHGAWWNATVWSECRAMAAAYFDEIGARYREVATRCADLSESYRQISADLKGAGDKALASEPKIALLRHAQELERQAVDGIEALAATGLRDAALSAS